MSIVIVVVAVILTAAAAGTIFRIVRGPSLLDRVLAIDVLLAIFAGALAVDMAYKGNLDNLVLLVAVSVVGFIGSVTVSRFVTDRRATGG